MFTNRAWMLKCFKLTKLNTHFPLCAAQSVALQALRQARPIYGADTGLVWSTSDIMEMMKFDYVFIVELIILEMKWSHFSLYYLLIIFVFPCLKSVPMCIFLYIFYIYLFVSFILLLFFFINVEMYPRVSMRVYLPSRVANPKTLGFGESFAV